MTAAQAAAWGNYASGLTRHDPRTGKSYHPAAITAFTALASKFLQATPAGTIPLTPPATAFAGDTIVFTATGAAGDYPVEDDELDDVLRGMAWGGKRQRG